MAPWCGKTEAEHRRRRLIRMPRNARLGWSRTGIEIRIRIRIKREKDGDCGGEDYFS